MPYHAYILAAGPFICVHYSKFTEMLIFDTYASDPHFDSRGPAASN